MEDSAYQALADARRRAVLCALLERRSIDLTEMLDGDGEEPVALYHQHLPMLADAGYVGWDRADERIERGDRFDVVRPLVAFHTDRTDPSSVTDPAASESVD